MLIELTLENQAELIFGNFNKIVLMYMKDL
jgi:hypothetical protein